MRKRIALLLLCSFVAAMFSGCCLIHKWENATCEAPKFCSECGKTDGNALGHTWRAATCTDAQTCITCGEKGGGALGHEWEAATCTDAKFCEVCGVTEGRALGHDWIEATQTTPRMCRTCETMEPMPTPASGEVFIGKGTYCGSSLTIRSSTTEACYIKLKDSNGNDVYSFFVPAGATVVAPVPSGYFYVYFAYGTDWYGPEYIFGPETDYAKDDQLSDFVSYSWEYTLYPSYGGNFSETPVDPDEF